MSSNRGERFDTSTRTWSALAGAATSSRRSATIAVAFGDDLAVIGPKSPTAGGVAVDLLAPGAERLAPLRLDRRLGPPLGIRRASRRPRRCSCGTRAVGYAWFHGDPATGPAEISACDGGPVSLDRVSETLLAIGGRRVFVWGGQSIPNGASGTSRPSNDGAILELPVGAGGGTVGRVKVTGTAAAARIVERAKRDRRGALVFTIGTGCCESTAPFLYEDFWPGPDSERVGEVAGVPVYAPEYLRALYPGDDGVTVDVDEGSMAESMSIETEYGCRFILRDPGGAPIDRQEPAGL